MMTNAETIKALIEAELSDVSDIRVQRHVRSLLVEPEAVLRDWDYGEPGQKYLCWIVLRESDTGICYCSEGFGPARPWGLIWLTRGKSMGMDSAWFRTFMEAYFDSAAAELPIWRAVQIDSRFVQTPVSGEQEWHAAWKQVEDLRIRHPESKYTVDHSIDHGKMEDK